MNWGNILPSTITILLVLGLLYALHESNLRQRRKQREAAIAEFERALESLKHCHAEALQLFRQAIDMIDALKPDHPLETIHEFERQLGECALDRIERYYLEGVRAYEKGESINAVRSNLHMLIENMQRIQKLVNNLDAYRSIYEPDLTEIDEIAACIAQEIAESGTCVSVNTRNAFTALAQQREALRPPSPKTGRKGAKAFLDTLSALERDFNSLHTRLHVELSAPAEAA